MMRVAIAVAATLISLTAKAAHPTWMEAPASFPNVRMYIHRDSGSEPSTVAVQKPEANDARVAKLLENLKATGPDIADLKPHECYELKRSDLKSRQTWCKSAGGSYFAFIEMGPLRMKPLDLRNAQLAALEETK